jgi:hypothetical protein
MRAGTRYRRPGRPDMAGADDGRADVIFPAPGIWPPACQRQIKQIWTTWTATRLICK